MRGQRHSAGQASGRQPPNVDGSGP
jgi:hypothetical protein